MGVRIRSKSGAVAVVDEATAAAVLGDVWVRVDGAAEPVAAAVEAPAPVTESVEPAAPEPADPTETAAPAGAPKPSASVGEWARYAESLGIDAGEMTKAQIQEAVKGH